MAASPPRTRAQSKAAARRRLAAKHEDPTIRAEDNGMTPLMPANLLVPGKYQADWFGQNLNLYAKARELVEGDNFVGAVHGIKLGYFNDGFAVRSADAGVKTWLEAGSASLARVARDAWTEWLMEDNAVAFWLAAKEGNENPPAVVILDTEMCSYSNRLGVEELKVKPKQEAVSPARRMALGKRWADAFEKGTQITLDPEQGECFRVLTRAKLGNGLGVPRLKQALKMLSTYELLANADWAGAFLAKNVIRQFKKGHEIRSGDHAGKPMHFITKKQADALVKAIKDKTGPFDMISNFDLDVAFQYLPAAFFDKKKYDGVIEHLNLWAGPAALMRNSGNLSPHLMDMFQAEGMANRAMMREFLEGIFNDPTFAPPYAAWAGKPRLKVRFNPRSFLSTKLLLEWVRVAVPNGLAAPQTGSEALGLDTEEEQALMKQARANKENFTPVFEAKQGMLSGNAGGRPSTAPQTETPPTGGA